MLKTVFRRRFSQLRFRNIFEKILKTAKITKIRWEEWKCETTKKLVKKRYLLENVRNPVNLVWGTVGALEEGIFFTSNFYDEWKTPAPSPERFSTFAAEELGFYGYWSVVAREGVLDNFNGGTIIVKKKEKEIYLTITNRVRWTCRWHVGEHILGQFFFMQVRWAFVWSS